MKDEIVSCGGCVISNYDPPDNCPLGDQKHESYTTEITVDEKAFKLRHYGPAIKGRWCNIEITVPDKKGNWTGSENKRWGGIELQ